MSLFQFKPLQNSFHQKQHLQDTKNQLLSASSCLCVDMRAWYLNRSSMRKFSSQQLCMVKEIKKLMQKEQILYFTLRPTPS
jgi:hypothetical protein